MDAVAERRQRPIRGNVTFDPLAPAVPTRDLAIEEVLDCDIGAFVGTRSYISGKRYDELVNERTIVRERLGRQPRFRCSLCAVPVYIVAKKSKHFFFRHKTEDGRCPAETRGPLSQQEIRACKYNGVRESQPHLRIKALIERSLLADPAFADVHTERQWRSSLDPRSRRQPDVQARGPMGRAAFEVQLSTTFLDVVVGRRMFYRDEGALLVWVMGRFDPEYRRLTTDDLLFSNNSNILVVDNETAALSEAACRFHVRCHYRWPVRDGDCLNDVWESRVIPFAELTFEMEAQRYWYANYDGQAATIRAAIEQEQQERQKSATDFLRSELINFWTARIPHVIPDESTVHEWTELRHALARRGIELPTTPDGDNSFVALMNGLTSAKAGRPVGWNFRHLIEVAHLIADTYPCHVLSFGFAIKHFGQDDMLNGQDRSGKWNRRASTIKQSLQNRRRDFMPDPATLPLVCFLFPSIGERIQAWMAKSASP